MKKNILILIIISSFTFSQDSIDKLSFYGGISYTSSKDADPIPGLSLGIGYDISENVTIGGGLAHRGGKYKKEENDFMGQIELHGTALELWSTFSVSNFYIGPSFSYIIKFNNGAPGTPFGVEKKENDYGFLLGLKLPLQIYGANINIGYYNGMNNEDYDSFFLRLVF